jgi:hypothetical protein
MKRTSTDKSLRYGAAVVIFAAGFVCGTVGQRRADAQLGDMGGKMMEKAGQQGGAVGGAAQLATNIGDMQKHVEGLQKNLEAFKKVQALLGG